MDIKYKWYEKFWVNWLILTFVQLLPFLLSSFRNLNFSLPQNIESFINIFVPIGFFNFIFSISAKGFITIPLLFLSFIFIDKLSKKIGIRNTFKKIFFNLLILFILTAVIDTVLWGNPCSIKEFLAIFINIDSACIHASF